MTVGLSSANVATPWLNFFRGTNTTTAPASLYAELHTADPGAAGTTSVSVGSATRNSFTFAAPSGNALALSGAPAAWTNGGTSETLTHVAIWSASTAGTFFFSAALTSSQAWASGNTFTLTSLSVSLSPIAA
ncbi:MAG: hypothetical protein KGL35_12105 [Bradyrhizobium sp.]|nr:hypothetical protein [Bradyrhizobium sp.]